MTTAPADWYPDPANDARLRYWDGSAWTGWLVDKERPTVVWHESPSWTPRVPGQISVPLSVTLSAF